MAAGTVNRVARAAAAAERLRHRLEDIEHLRTHNVHPLLIAQILGMKPSALEAYFYRKGRPDVAALFLPGWGDTDINDSSLERSAA